MKRFLLTIIAIVSVFSLLAQTPGSFSYQAVVRNVSGNPIVSQNVACRFSILAGSVGGSVVYSEKHSTTTNQFGMITLSVGNGTDKTGNLESVSWGTNTYFLKVEIDPAGGSAYLNMGTTQLLSVPYALHAKTAESVSGGLNFLPPSASVLPASDIQSFTSTLNGTVNGKGFLTNVIFEWGLTTSYGNSVNAIQSPVTGSADAAVSAGITGLQSASLYHFRIKASNAVNLTISSDLTFTTAPSSPILTTAVASSIAGTTAVSGGTISFDGGSAITARGVCYATSPAPTLSNSVTSDGVGTGAFISNLTGLTTNTTYYVRAYATNTIGTTYGNEISFKTVSVPTVTTSVVTAINGITAKAGGAVTADGGSAVTVSGLCWGTSPNPTILNSVNTSFTDAMTGLTTGTVYYVRAYATNVAGTGYGGQVGFNSGQVLGSTFAGGLVFYNDANGHGLVCTPSELSSGASWGCEGTAIPGTSVNIGTGAANTAAIVAGCSTAGIAARLCNDLDYNTFVDWYLPSKDELNLMLVNLHLQAMGGFVTNGYYWCSTEFGAAYAWVQRFSVGGTQANASKNASYNVRAVRAF
jgi:hypothetical protein